MLPDRRAPLEVLIHRHQEARYAAVLSRPALVALQLIPMLRCANLDFHEADWAALIAYEDVQTPGTHERFLDLEARRRSINGEGPQQRTRVEIGQVGEQTGD